MGPGHDPDPYGHAAAAGPGAAPLPESDVSDNLGPPRPAKARLSTRLGPALTARLPTRLLPALWPAEAGDKACVKRAR